MEDHFSWSDSLRAVFGSCLYCFRSPQDDSQDENHSHHRSSAPGPRLGVQTRRDELEGLLADSDEAETLSLHSNIGDRERRRKKKRRPRKGIRLFGYDLFGRPPIYLSDDEDGGRVGRRRGQPRLGNAEGEHSEAEDLERVRTLSTSTLDSDAAPLDPSTIDELSAAQLAASLAREEEERKAREEERKAKEERRRKRRERKELKKAAMALAMDGHGEGEFEGFPVCRLCLLFCSRKSDVLFREAVRRMGPYPLHSTMSKPKARRSPQRLLSLTRTLERSRKANSLTIVCLKTLMMPTTTAQTLVRRRIRNGQQATRTEVAPTLVLGPPLQALTPILRGIITTSSLNNFLLDLVQTLLIIHSCHLRLYLQGKNRVITTRRKSQSLEGRLDSPFLPLHNRLHSPLRLRIQATSNSTPRLCWSPMGMVSSRP